MISVSTYLKFWEWFFFDYIPTKCTKRRFWRKSKIFLL